MVKEPKLKEIVAKNLKTARIRAGLTQEQLAKSARVTSRYISILETRPKNLTLESLENICKALKITPCELICEKKLLTEPKASLELAITILERALKEYG